MPRSTCVLSLAMVVITCVFAPALAYGNEAPPQAAVPVKAIRVSPAEKNIITGMGSVSCTNAMDLGFDTTGVLSEVLVKEGERVEEGQPLVKLDQRVADCEIAVEKAAAAAAEAEHNLQSAEYLKKEELFNKEALSESELARALFEKERARAQIESTARKVEAAETKKARMTLLAPMAGVISKIYLKAGEVVNYSSFKVLRLIDCHEADAEIELGEKSYTLVGPDQSVSLVVDALPGRIFTGVIYQVSPEINPRNRTFNVKARVSNPGLLLRPGMFVRGEIDLTRGKGPVYIPDGAILPKEDGSDAVYVVKDGVALKRRVKIDRRDHGRVGILDGLNEGDLVIVEGQDKVAEMSDVSVSIIEDRGAGTAE